MSTPRDPTSDQSASRVTLRDVARQAGVHVSTVSRVLNGQADQVRISPATESRIQEVATDLGYLKNSIGRALRTGRSGIIGMLVPDVGNPYQSGITQAAAGVLAQRGYSLLLANTGERSSDAQLHVSAMLGAQAEGFLYGVARRGDRVLRGLQASGSPVVLFNRTLDRSGCSAVITDDRAGMEAGVGHLVDLGHRAIAHVGGPSDVSSGARRRRYFDEALQRRGLSGSSVHADRHTEDEGERAGQAVLDRDPGTSGIVTDNDRLAIGVIAAARARGLTCPGDISVTGFNDMPYADLLDPPLTTVRVSQSELGERAAILLVEEIEHPGRRTRTERVRVELVVRGSTGPVTSDRH